MRAVHTAPGKCKDTGEGSVYKSDNGMSIFTERA